MGLFNFGSKKEYEDEIRRVVNVINNQLKDRDYFSASFSCQDIAKLATEKGDTATAIKYLDFAADYSLKDNRLYTAGWVYRELANLYFREKNYTKAIENAVKSAELLLKANSKYAAQWAYNLAAKAAEARGDIYASIRYYRRSLDLGEDSSIKEEINRLKKKAPHPIVLELTDKPEAKEGEEVEFKVIVENNSLEPIRKIRLLDKYNNLISEVNDLAPHEEKYFSFKTTGRVGLVRPAYKKIAWENIIGDSFEEPIESIAVKVTPNVEVIISSNPPLRLNRPSNFVILARNKSLSSIKHVKFFANFPDSLTVRQLTKTDFERISPEEEKGAVFSITPLVVGESKVTGIKIEYKDEYDDKHENMVGSFVLREALEEEKTQKTKSQVLEELGKSGVEYLKSIEAKRKELKLSPYPLSQEEYLKLAGKHFSSEKGYTLRNIPLDYLTSHILNACEDMALINSYNFENERLFLFSGVDLDRVYLLTVAVRQEESLLNVLFKAYSNKQETLEKFLNNIADIIEYTSMVMSSAKEVEKIEVKQVIKIIDSIVQRSQIGSPSAKTKETVIKDSVVQRAGV